MPPRQTRSIPEHIQPPLPDPDILLREANRAKRIARASQPTPPPLGPSTPLPVQPSSKPHTTDPPATTADPPIDTTPAMSEDNLSTRELMRLMLQTQIENARRDVAREEEFERRQAALEEVVLKLSQASLVNRQSSHVEDPAKPTSGIDLTRFRTSDGPVFKGPYHDVEAFLTWFKSLKAFFRTKGVTLDFDRITLVGNFITEPNTQAFYEAECEDFIRGS